MNIKPPKLKIDLQKKQWLILIAIVVLIVTTSILLAVWLNSSGTNSHTNPTTKPLKTTQISLGSATSDKDSWRTQASADLERMSKRILELEQSQQLKENLNKSNSSSYVFPNTQLIVPPPNLYAPNLSSDKPSDKPVAINQVSVAVAEANALTRITPAIPKIKTSVSENNEPFNQKFEQNLINSAQAFGKEEERKRNSNSGVSKIQDDEEVASVDQFDKNSEQYIPAGSFVKAILLNGLDAPTGGQAQQNPHPVLLFLQESAQLPNNFKSQVKGCFVTGSGHGDLSSERAYIRLDRMSCIHANGEAVDVAVRGYVSGEDGKVGVRGRLITKSGQVLANAVVVGILSGLGEALRQGAVTTTTATATGAQTNAVNNALEYGVGTGIGKAMDRVAQYYIKLAEKLFPIVEVDAGRTVDIILTRGVTIAKNL